MLPKYHCPVCHREHRLGFHRLTKIEAEILILYYLHPPKTRWSLAKIGRRYHLSVSRVRQLRDRALHRLGIQPNFPKSLGTTTIPEASTSTPLACYLRAEYEACTWPRAGEWISLADLVLQSRSPSL